MVRPLPAKAPLVVLLLLALSPAGCRRQADRTPPPSTTPPPPNQAAKRAADASPSTEDPCASLRAQFRQVLAAGASRTCQRAEQCGCYPALTDCGGVADAVTVERLRTLARMFRLAGCSLPRCDAQVPCRPACVGGRCVSSAHG